MAEQITPLLLFLPKACLNWGVNREKPGLWINPVIRTTRCLWRQASRRMFFPPSSSASPCCGRKVGAFREVVQEMRRSNSGFY